MEDKVKRAAAISAVMAYIKSEEEAACTLPAPAAPEKKAAPQEIKLWGISGRQTQMQLRNMMQLKAFHGTR